MKEEKVGGREREGSQAWWSTQVISELRRWRHEDLELKVILGYVTRVRWSTRAPA